MKRKGFTLLIEVLIVLALVGFMVTVAISVSISATRPANSSVGKTERVGTVDVVVYDNDSFYYFPCDGALYGNTLPLFKKRHPDLKVTSQAPNDKGGNTKGYFVTFGPKAPLTAEKED